MFRWILLFLAVALGLLGSLTVVQSPDWAPWRLGVLAGEFGHWLALGGLLFAMLAWLSRGPAVGIAVATVLICAGAIGLLLKPCVEASQVAESLPAKLEREFGPVAIDRVPFSLSNLFGRDPQPVAVQTMLFAEELPLDFFPAVRADASPAPCVIVVHGGGWDSGDRHQIPQLNHWLARKGYAVAAISYRLAPKFVWPAQRDDVRAAIAFLKAHARELGIDPARFVMLGRSAGGQIAEAVAYTPDDPAIRGLVALYAPSDMTFAYANSHEDDAIKSPKLMRQFLGGTPETAGAAYEDASGYGHVAKGAPPTLLIHGRIDALTWYRHSERLDARLAERGVPHVYVLLPWATHAFEFNLHGPGGQLTTFALEWFLASVTK